MPRRAITIRPLPCTMCGATVNVSSLTSPTSGAPELLQPPEGAWIGIMIGRRPGSVELVVACSELCAQKLLSA